MPSKDLKIEKNSGKQSASHLHYQFILFFIVKAISTEHMSKLYCYIYSDGETWRGL